MQGIEQTVGKEEEAEEEESLRRQDGNNSSLSPRGSGGCFDDKAVYFHRLSAA